jgi:hypothetical protein
MAVDLTTPDTGKTVSQEAVIVYDVSIPHVFSVADNKFIIDKSNVQLRYKIQKFAQDGTIIGQDQDFVAFADMPASLKQALKSAYEEVELYAQSVGIIAPGTPETL